MVVLKGAERSESCDRTVKGLLVLHAVRWQGLSDPQSDQLQSVRHLRQSEKADADGSVAIYIQHERSWEGQGERLVVADGRHVRLWHLADVYAGGEHVRPKADMGGHGTSFILVFGSGLACLHGALAGRVFRMTLVAALDIPPPAAR